MTGVCQKLVEIFNIAQERDGVSPSVLCLLVQTHRRANAPALAMHPLYFYTPEYDARGFHCLFSRQLIELLLESGLTLSDENNDGETPLDWATGASMASRSGGGGYGGFGGGGSVEPPSHLTRLTTCCQ